MPRSAFGIIQIEPSASGFAFIPEFSQIFAEKFEDRAWEGIEGGLTAAVAHMELEAVPEESLLVAYILLLLVELDGSVTTGVGGDLVGGPGDGLGGGTPQSDLLPQMMFDCCCC